jgi:type II secretory pathway pseudopilin PulG
MVRRTGFSLVEAMVALVVLEITLVAVVGGSLYALRLLRSAEARQMAVLSSSSVLDSLLSIDSVSAGRRWERGIELNWAPEPGALVVTASYPLGAQRDTLWFRVSRW